MKQHLVRKCLVNGSYYHCSYVVIYIYCYYNCYIIIFKILRPCGHIVVVLQV